MDSHTYSNKAAYDRCGQCGGILMDEAVFRMLKQEWLSEKIIDPPPFDRGRHANENIELSCPVCSQAMVPLVDPIQSHVCLDYCSHCTLLYFDAGEFTDLKELTFMDYIWAFLARLKK